MGIVLVASLLTPVAAAVVVALGGNRRPDVARRVALATTLVTLGMVLALVVGFERRQSGLEAGVISPTNVVRVPWLTLDVPSPKGGITTASLDFHVGLDGLSLYLVLLTAIMMVPAVLVSWNAIEDRVAEYYALLLLLETSMLGVFVSFDIILFYVFFEFTLIPLYFLIGQWGGPRRRYAAGKFFIYTLTGSLLALVGLVALVLTLHARDGQAISFSIPELADRMHAQVQLAEGVGVGASLPPAEQAEIKDFWTHAQWWIFLALFAGFAIKVPLFPLHTWLPLVHVEAPTAGSVQLACVLLKLGTFGFLRLCLPLVPYGSIQPGVPLVAWLASIGIVYGALCAVAQTDVKRLVAYSSVSHLGFCMLGAFALNSEGITGSVIQSINHGLSTGGLFLLIGMLYERYHTRDTRELGGVASKLPLFAFFFVFICLSSAGLPGLNGFMGEMLTLVGMFKFHWGFACVGATGVILGAWYIFTMMKGYLFGPLREPAHVHGPIGDLSGREIAIIAPIAALCLAIGLYPKPMIDALKPEVDPLMAMFSKIEVDAGGPAKTVARQATASQSTAAGQTAIDSRRSDPSTMSRAESAATHTSNDSTARSAFADPRTALKDRERHDPKALARRESGD